MKKFYTWPQASNSCFQNLPNSLPNLAAGCRSDRPRMAPSALRPTLLSPTCVGVQLSRKVVPKKEASCHGTAVANSGWCAKLFAGFSIIIIPVRCVSIWKWKFRLGFVGHFVSVLHGMSRTVSAVREITGSFTQQKAITPQKCWRETDLWHKINESPQKYTECTTGLAGILLIF